MPRLVSHASGSAKKGEKEISEKRRGKEGRLVRCAAAPVEALGLHQSGREERSERGEKERGERGHPQKGVRHTPQIRPGFFFSMLSLNPASSLSVSLHQGL